MFGWGADGVIRQWPRLRPAIATLAVIACCAWMSLAHAQAAYWQNGVTILQHALEVTGDNKWARLLLGEAHYIQGTKLMNAGHSAEAIDQFEEALRVRPNYAEAHNNLGIQLASLPGRVAEALPHFESAVRIAPTMAQAQRNLGMALAAIPGRAAEAREHLQIAQRLQPDPQILQMLNRLQ